MYEEVTVIYADVLFLINFSLDYLCLFITGRLLNKGGRALRLFLGALLGGLYSFVPYFFVLNPLIAIILHLSAAGVICFIAFGQEDFGKFLITVGSFAVSSALMGGLISALFNLSAGYSNGVYKEVSGASFAIALLISAVIALSYGFLGRRRLKISSAEVRVFLEGEHIDLRLLADSGNLVTEPFSSLPVIIVSSSSLPFPYDRPRDDGFPLPIRIIPFNTSAGSGCFLGFRPAKIELRRLAKKPKTICAYIGIDTENHPYSGYDGLIPTSLL